MSDEAGGLDFVQVYQAQLVPVWRYVRSRIANHHEAQDVTSEVFARAWRSWSRFDARRGDVSPWLFRIAQRTVVDWNRHRGRQVEGQSLDLEGTDGVSVDPSELPEAILLAREVLAEVREALAGLTVRERDGIALRFGAGLKMAAIGRVLGLSSGATKMMLARSLTKLAVEIARRRGQPAAIEQPLLLDDLVEQALERGGVTLVPEIRDLVLQLAVIHRPTLPADLPTNVQLCVDCASGLFGRARRPRPDGRHRPHSTTHRLGFSPSLAFSWFPLAPLCLACTIPLLITPLLAIGLTMDVAIVLHVLSLASAPVVVVLLYRRVRRHREWLGSSIASAGGVLLLAHLVGHMVVPDSVPPWSVVADQLGTGMLIGGTFLDAGAMRSWALQQRHRLADAAAGFRLATA